MTNEHAMQMHDTLLTRVHAHPFLTRIVAMPSYAESGGLVQIGKINAKKYRLATK